MTFLTKIDFIAGQNNPPVHIGLWVGSTVWVETNGEIASKTDNSNQGSVGVFCTLEGENKYYKSFKGSNRDIDGFMDLYLSWFLLSVIATDAERNEKPHILS